MTNKEGEKNMKAGVKPIQPMNIEFDTQAQVTKFINWATGNEAEKQTTKNVRSKFAAYIQMKKRG